MTPLVLLFSSMAMLLAPVAAFAPHGVAPVAAIGAILSLFDPRVRRGLHPKYQPIWALAFFLAILWALITVTWTYDPARALRLSGSLIALLLIARALVIAADQLTNEERDLLAKNLVYAGSLLAALLIFENTTNGLITKIFHVFPGKTDDHMPALNPGAVILAILAWPLAAAAARWRGWRWGAVLMVFIALSVYLARTKTPFGALSLSVLLFPTLAYCGRWAARLFCLLPSFFLVVAPYVFHFLLYPVEARERFSRLISPWYPDGERLILLSFSRTWEYRTWIWRFVVEHIEKRPFLGWGLDASRSIEGGRNPVAGYETTFGEVLPLHPHNAFLQIWLELGGVGAVLLALAIGILLRTIERGSKNKKDFAAIAALISTYFIVGQVSFGVWQNWWLATAILAATFYLVVRVKPQSV